ncbi:MAG: hypothetical protein AB2L13_06135 [Spirochaetota bacterium]
MFGSHSLGLSAGYSESEDSDGKTTSSGNFGGNFSVSSSTKKWVTEQTSLTGNSVNIYVENKTTLKGAVIASTSNDLTLDTGSFEYIHIKDKDISYNFGGGANAGANYTGKPDEKNNTWSVNASYGFSQKRQTNFATIGEGTIIVRDGNTDLSGLNRDITKAQYGTVDIGLKGGFTVDSSTVALVTSPIKTIAETYAALEKGYEDAAKTSADIYAESIIMYEKTGNWIDEKGFYTRDELLRIDALNTELKEALAYFIPDTDTAKYGIYINRNLIGDRDITGITDYNQDGSNRITQFDLFGNVINDYYWVKNLDTADATTYGSREYIQALNYLGVTDPGLVKILTYSLNMAPNGALQKEISDAIPKIINNKGLDASSIRQTACVSAGLYIDLVLSGADVGKFSEFFADNVNAGYIRGKDASITQENQKAIVASYGKELIIVPQVEYNNFEKLTVSGDINYGVIRYYDKNLKSEHNMNLYRDNGIMNVSDAGNKTNHGKPATSPIITEESYRYFEHIK